MSDAGPKGSEGSRRADDAGGAPLSLGASAELYRELVENLNEGLWVVDEKGITTFVNEPMADLLGYSVEEMTGKHLFDFMEERARATCERNLERRRQGIREVHDFEFLAKDGTRIHTLVQTSPLRDSEGRYRGAIAGVIDISARKKAEDDLREERNFTNAILSTAGALVVVLDPAGRIVRFNRTCERVTGYTFEEVHARPLWEVLIAPEEIDGVREVFSRLRLGQLPSQHENWWVARDGSRRRIAWSNTALTDPDGAVTFVIGTGLDVTDLREAETRLRALNEGLEQQVRERTAEAERRADQIRALAFKLGEAEQNERRRLAGVLHDHLQQTLVAARFRMSGLRSLEERPEARQMIAELDALLSEALEASRSLTADLNPSMLCEEGLAAGLRWLSRSMEAKHGLRVELRAEDEGLVRRPLAVFLFEAVRELLFNVVKHGHVTEARVVLRRDADGSIDVRVEDHGAGFDPGSLAREGRPTGFGLWGIRERLELHGGRLALDARPGGGTRVRLVVPPEGRGEGRPEL